MRHEKNQELIDMLNICAIECSHCAMACLDEKDVNRMVKCIRLDIYCSDICRLTASLLSRGSEHGNYLLKECTEVCEACAEECEKHCQLEHCKKCAEACRTCAEACLSRVAA